MSCWRQRQLAEPAKLLAQETRVRLGQRRPIDAALGIVLIQPPQDVPEPVLLLGGGLLVVSQILGDLVEIRQRLGGPGDFAR